MFGIPPKYSTTAVHRSAADTATGMPFPDPFPKARRTVAGAMSSFAAPLSSTSKVLKALLKIPVNPPGPGVTTAAGMPLPEHPSDPRRQRRRSGQRPPHEPSAGRCKGFASGRAEWQMLPLCAAISGRRVGQPSSGEMSGLDRRQQRVAAPLRLPSCASGFSSAASARCQAEK
jgi:hypothetical protein